MGTMTKSDLIEEVARRTGITRSRAELVVNCVFDSFAESLKEGNGIEVRGFGSFSIREYGAYQGRNPRNNEPVTVAPKKLPFFKVGKELREMVNARAGTPLPEDHDAPDETDLDENDPEIDEESDE
jgi:integration host factor subunit beta